MSNKQVWITKSEQKTKTKTRQHGLWKQFSKILTLRFSCPLKSRSFLENIHQNNFRKQLVELVFSCIHRRKTFLSFSQSSRNWNEDWGMMVAYMTGYFWGLQCQCNTSFIAWFKKLSFNKASSLQELHRYLPDIVFVFEMILDTRTRVSCHKHQMHQLHNSRPVVHANCPLVSTEHVVPNWPEEGTSPGASCFRWGFRTGQHEKKQTVFLFVG